MKITNKKILAATLSLGLILAGCGKDQKAEEKPGETQTEQAPAEKEQSTETANQEDYDFSVVSREEGSGTRGAFIELVGLEEEVDGSKEDMTTQEAIVQNSTNGVMQTVSQDKEAIMPKLLATFPLVP